VRADELAGRVLDGRDACLRGQERSSRRTWREETEDRDDNCRDHRGKPEASACAASPTPGSFVHARQSRSRRRRRGALVGKLSG